MPKHEVLFKDISETPEGYIYELVRPYAYKLPEKIKPDIITEEVCIQFGDILVIREGFQWDGASDPAIDDMTNMRAALVHDGMYCLLEQGLLGVPDGDEWKHWRKIADQQLRKIMREDGAPWWRAWYYYWAVRLFGASYARS